MSIQESKEASSSRLFHFSNERWKREDCTDKAVQDLVIQYFKALCEDAIFREENVKSDKNILNLGFWYANSYFQHLKDYQQTTRLDWLKKRGHFYHGFPPKNFSTTPDEINPPARLTGIKANHYQLKEGILPSDGLDELLPGKNSQFFFIDCHIAIQIAHFCALRVIFGKDLFNAYFQQIPLILTPSKNPSLMPLYSFREDAEPPRYGESCFFQNVPVYHIKHMDGEAGGFHVICTSESGEPKYAGFGLASVESTAQQIHALLADEFNKDPIPLKDLLPEKWASRREGPSYSELHPVEAKLAQDIRLTEDTISETARQYPDKVGLNKLKFKLSSEKIQNLIDSIIS